MKQKILYKNAREFLLSFFPESIVSSEKFFHQREKKRKQKHYNFLQTIKSIEHLLFENFTYAFSEYTVFIGQSFTNLQAHTPSIFACVEKFSNDNLLQSKRFDESRVFLQKIPLLMEAHTFQSSAFSILYPASHLHAALLKKHTTKQRFSDYKLQLRERKKLSILYGGISRKQLLRAYEETKKLPGVHAERMLFFLEQRLDVVLSRSFFLKIQSARQYIQHKKVRVNGEIISICSFRLKAGDCVKFDKGAFPQISAHLLQCVKKKLQKRSSRYVLSSTTLSNLLHAMQKKTSRFFLQQYFSQKNFQRSFLGHIACVKLAVENARTENQWMVTFLKCKSLLYTKQLQTKRMIAMNVHPMKALHVEVSYKLLQAIVLYSPQLLLYPTVIDFESIQRSFKHS